MTPDSQPPARRGTQESSPEPASLEWLSALTDGQADALDAGCAQWRDNPQARRRWHDYHLIGDVMRSEELARRPAGAAAFLSGVRARLAHEPAVLAPLAAPQSPRAADANAERQARPAWALPVAVAAGFVVVAGVLVVARMGPVVAPGRSVEMAATEASGAALALRPAVDRQAVIVDPRLEEFLRLHQASSGGTAAVVPGGALRRVDVVVPVAPGR